MRGADVRRLMRIGLATALALSMVVDPALAAPARTRLVSKTSEGDPATGDSREGTVSADGRFVAFTSIAGNLPGANGVTQIYVHDRGTGRTRLVSKTTGGDPADGSSEDPSISADGRFVAFESEADNLPGLTSLEDVFVHDRRTGRTRLVSKTSGGAPADAESNSPSISGNGRYVAFRSDADNLGGDPAHDNVFIHDRRLGKTRLVSKTSGGVPANSNSEDPAVSFSGRFISFDSTAPNLPGPNVVEFRIYVHDRRTGATELVSRRSNGDPADSGSFDSTISARGRYVAFESLADNLPGRDGVTDVYVHDRRSGRTRLVSRSSSGASGNDFSNDAAISGSGRYVAFESEATNLDGGSGFQDVFVRDLIRGRTRLVSQTSDGDPLTAESESVRCQRVVSDDGRFVLFSSAAMELPGQDGVGSVYVRGPLP
jgi:Tol biopolymer transport system component